MSTETQKVDVIAVLSLHAEMREAAGKPNLANELRSARGAVAELIEAVKENRRLTEVFAKDGSPENYFPYDESERRVLRALEAIGSTP